MPQPFDAIVFDLDGTLVDTAPDLRAHLNEMLAELGRPGLTLDEVRPLIGDGARALLRRGLEKSGGVPAGVDLDTLFERFLTRYTAAPARFGAPYEGVALVLEEFTHAGVRLGVCTNKAQEASLAVLGAFGLARFFPVVIGGDVLPVRKPDPGHLRAVLERLGANGRPAAMVGDSAYDLLTAQAAEVPCVLLSSGYTVVPVRELGGGVVIDSFKELPEALAALARAAP